MAACCLGVGVTEIPVAAELARLRAENARLLKMLKLSPRQAATPGPVQAGFFDAPPGPVHKDSSNDAKVAFFRALFAARTDIYATRIENSGEGPLNAGPVVSRRDRRSAQALAQVPAATLAGLPRAPRECEHWMTRHQTQAAIARDRRTGASRRPRWVAVACV
jgi:hypothetical protein